MPTIVDIGGSTANAYFINMGPVGRLSTNTIFYFDLKIPVSKIKRLLVVYNLSGESARFSVYQNGEWSDSNSGRYARFEGEQLKVTIEAYNEYSFGWIYYD